MPDAADGGQSREQARTRRQHADVAAGLNPLTRTPIHPSAPTDASPHDRFPRAGTCGTCAFLVQITQGSSLALKCGFEPPKYPRITLSANSDVRRWWPGCGDYQPAQ